GGPAARPRHGLPGAARAPAGGHSTAGAAGDAHPAGPGGPGVQRGLARRIRAAGGPGDGGRAVRGPGRPGDRTAHPARRAGRRRQRRRPGRPGGARGRRLTGDRATNRLGCTILLRACRASPGVHPPATQHSNDRNGATLPSCLRGTDPRRSPTVIWKRPLVVTAALSLAAAALTACGPVASTGSNAGDTEGGGDKTVTVFISGDTNVQDLWEKGIIPAYQKANPGVQVKTTIDLHGEHDQQTVAKLVTATKAGDDPGYDLVDGGFVIGAAAEADTLLQADPGKIT